MAGGLESAVGRGLAGGGARRSHPAACSDHLQRRPLPHDKVRGSLSPRPRLPEEPVLTGPERTEPGGTARWEELGTGQGLHTPAWQRDPVLF